MEYKKSIFFIRIFSEFGLGNVAFMRSWPEMATLREGYGGDLCTAADRVDNKKHLSILNTSVKLRQLIRSKIV